MLVLDQLLSSLEQVAAVMALAGIIYCLRWLFFRKTRNSQSFFEYLGITQPHKQLDMNFMLILIALIAYAILSTALQYHFSNDFQLMIKSDHSPYGVILKNGISFQAVMLGLIYCFIRAAASEEVLFRGLIAKRLFSTFGFFRGNIAQALIFWLMHFVIFKLVMGEWFSVLQLIIFITSFGLGQILGYVNFRKGGTSILPSWLLHGCVNFFSFLTLAALAA